MHREVLIRDRPALLAAKGESSNVWTNNFDMLVIRERDPMPYPDHTGKDHSPGERGCTLCEANCEEFRVPAWAATSIYDRGWREGQMILRGIEEAARAEGRREAVRMDLLIEAMKRARPFVDFGSPEQYGPRTAIEYDRLVAGLNASESPPTPEWRLEGIEEATVDQQMEQHRKSGEALL